VFGSTLALQLERVIHLLGSVSLILFEISTYGKAKCAIDKNKKSKLKIKIDLIVAGK
jgi:hypothetical protein